MRKKIGNHIELVPDLKYSRPILLSLILAAVLVRAVALFSIKETVYFNYLLYDERIFHVWAEKIANGTFISNSVYEFAPLYPYLIALVYKLFSADVLYIRILNILFGVAGCYVIYLIGKELAGRTVGLLSCLVAVFYEPFIFYSIVPLKAAFSVFLFALMVYFLLVFLKKNTALVVIACGFTLGLLLNVRPQALVIVPLLPCLMFLNKLKSKTKITVIISHFVLYAFGLALALSPFIVRNYTAAGKFALTTSQTGFNLYRANKLGPPVPVNFAVTSPSKQETQFRIEASRRIGKKLSPKEASEYWKQETFRVIKSNPLAFLENITRKIFIFFQRHQLTDHYHIQFMGRFMNVLNFPFFTFNTVMPLGMAGLLLFACRYRNVAALLAIFMVYGSTMIIIFMRTRYRLPLMAILIPMAVMSLCLVATAMKEKKVKEVAVYILTTILFVIVQCFPVHGTDDLTAYYNGHALALSSKGKKKEAVVFWKQSSDRKGAYSDFANLSLAGYYLTRRNYIESLKYIELIEDSSYAVAQKYLIIGNMMYLQRKMDNAAAAYERSLTYNSGQVFPHRRLINIYNKSDKIKEIESRRKLKYILSFQES